MLIFARYLRDIQKHCGMNCGYPPDIWDTSRNIGEMKCEYLPDIIEISARYLETLGEGGHLVLGARMLHAIHGVAGSDQAGADVATHVSFLLQALPHNTRH